MTQELKPCPFCGGKATLRSTTNSSYCGGFFVMCNVCLTSSDNFNHSNDAIRHWNTRYDDTKGGEANP